MKLLDSVIGRIAASVIPVDTPYESSSIITSLLLIRPGGIGDAVLLAPIIRTIKVKYPLARISVLAERRNAGVFSLVSDVGEVFCYDRPRDFLRAVTGQYDAVIDTEQSHFLSAVVTRFTSAPLKIGFDTNGRRRMFTQTVPYCHDDYESVSFARLLTALGIEAGCVELAAPFLSLPGSAINKAADLLEPFNGQPFVALFPGASIHERRWGAERFRRVGEVLSVLGIKMVVVGGSEDRQQGDGITAGGLGLNLTGTTSLSETAAIINKSAMLLSGDSGVLHIAVGLGVPTVSLFGPGRAKKWAPLGAQHIVINKELPCSPCTTFGTTPSCPIHAQCMRDITVDEVVNSVTVLLTSIGAMPSRCCKRDWIEIA